MSKVKDKKIKKEDDEKIDLSMKVYKGSRENIKERELQKNGTIPGFGATCFVGTTGSGKTNVAVNLLADPRFMGKINGKPYYDLVFLFCFSPSDLMISNLEGILEEKRVFMKPDPSILKNILDKQEQLVKKVGFKNSPHILIVLDDVISSPKFVKNEAVSKLFFQGTHFKITTWIMVQSYMALPRWYRINCHYLLFFSGANQDEIEKFTSEYQPKQLDKQEFMQMVKDVTTEPYSFLFVNNKVPDKKVKFRLGFDNIIQLHD